MDGALSEVTSLVTALDSWPEVVGLLVLALAFIAWQIVKGNKATARVEKTLTSNNGGSHVKDALDRIEAGLTDLTTTVQAQDARLTAVEERTEPEAKGRHAAN